MRPTKNLGTFDRILRLLLAFILLLFAWWQTSWIAAILGIFTLYEALASWCIIYSFFGKNTCPIKKQNK
jgi:Protein of unknown function (DUF2892)